VASGGFDEHQWSDDWAFSFYSAMRSVVWIRRVASASVILGAAAALASNASCVLIDGPADFPLAPTRRPTILRSQVVPSASIPLGEGELPSGGFIVPLEIPDPSQDVTWAAYADAPLAGGNLQQFEIINPQTIVGSADAPNITLASFEVPPSRLNGNSCHTIHFVVTLGTSVDNVDPDLSDSIDWGVVPFGNLGGCTTYDGGSNFSITPDASDDAGDGAVE
jgi:hypothetical protein